MNGAKKPTHPLWPGVAAITLALVSPLAAATIADTTADFSGVQGQDNWYYGYWSGTGAGYAPGAFTQMAPSAFNGSSWDPFPNPNFTTIGASGWHPNGGSGTGAFQSPMKRWIAENTGIITITGTWRNGDTARTINAASRNGTTVRIFAEGNLVYQQKVAWTAYPGDTAYTTASFAVDVGDRIDFMLDSDGDVNDDFTVWSSTLDFQPVPEPSSGILAMLAGGVLVVRRRRITKP